MTETKRKVGRFARLHTDTNREVAEKLAMLALDAEEKGGRSILYGTAHDLALLVGESAYDVRRALRLTYTAEFLAKYGWGFVAPGCGRSGAKYGYVLQHGKRDSALAETADALDYTDEWAYDHVRGLQAHWEQLSKAQGGRRTRQGKQAALAAEQLGGAAATIALIVAERGGSVGDDDELDD